MSFEEYSDLAKTGYHGGSKEQVAPEEEFFHSVYIAGKTRKNHINIEEKSTKFQVRGVQYNLDQVNMIITHTKDILVNAKQENGQERIICFSFKEGNPPWFGISTMVDGSKRQCPQTSAERAINDFCNNCRAQIIVAGIYCKEDGSPILTEDKKPIFIFIRGKGMRYSNVSNYLNDLYKEDLSPIFEPVTEQSKEFEKSVVNNKRFVTKLTKGEETSKFGGNVNIFILEKGTEIAKESVLSILKLSKQTFEKFNEKFDWSKTSTPQYGQTQAPEGVLPVDSPKESPAEEDSGVQSEKAFSFDDINF